MIGQQGTVAGLSEMARLIVVCQHTLVRCLDSPQAALHTCHNHWLAHTVNMVPALDGGTCALDSRLPHLRADVALSCDAGHMRVVCAPLPAVEAVLPEVPHLHALRTTNRHQHNDLVSRCAKSSTCAGTMPVNCTRWVSAILGTLDGP